MTYKLYGDLRSGACIVELALAEIGASYEFVPVSLGDDEQHKAEYAALNPQQKIPSLVDPLGDTLTESAAILVTLSERHPDADLLPPPRSPERAQALRWLLFVATEIYPVVEINDYPERFAGREQDARDAMRERARAIWRERWLVVEANIAGQPYLLPEGFCMTDIYIAVVSRWAQQDAWRPDNIPRVERLTSALAHRPALQSVWSRHFG